MKPISKKDLIAQLRTIASGNIGIASSVLTVMNEAAERLEELSAEPYTPTGEKKLADLQAQGGEHIRDAKVLRFPDGSERTIDKFGKVNWITKRQPDPRQKEFWSHNEEDSWVDSLDQIDTDQMFFDENNRAEIYLGDGRLIDSSKVINHRAVEDIFECISFYASELAQDHGCYLPEYWLGEFSGKASNKEELKQLIIGWLEDKGQLSHYTVDECKKIRVELVDGHLEEVE